MIGWLKRMYLDLPYERKLLIRRFFFPIKVLFSSAGELFFHVYEISGGEGALLITPTEPDLSFVRYFYPDAVLRKTGTISALSVRGVSRRNERVIIVTHRSLAQFFRAGLTTIPFVRQVASLEKPPESLKQFRKHRKEIQSYGIEITKSAESLKFFYENMYLPFTRSRHREALIEDFSKLQYILQDTGELLILSRDGEPVGGLFCKSSGDTYSVMSLGLVDDRWLGKDPIPALFYYSMVRGRELKARSIDFGESRPFLSDGVLEYKRRWGGRVVMNEQTKYYFILKNISRDGMIVLDNGNLSALLSPESEAVFLRHPDPGLGIRPMEPVTNGERAGTGNPPDQQQNRHLAFITGIVNRISGYPKIITRR